MSTNAKTLVLWVGFAIVKHAPRSDEFLTRLLLDTPRNFSEIPFITWNDVVMGFWIYSDKMLLIIPVYLSAALIVPYLYLRVE